MTATRARSTIPPTKRALLTFSSPPWEKTDIQTDYSIGKATPLHIGQVGDLAIGQVYNVLQERAAWRDCAGEARCRAR